LKAAAGGVTGNAVGWKITASKTFATVEIATLSAGDTGAGSIAGRVYSAGDFISAKFVSNKAGEAFSSRSQINTEIRI
jgi:hypothetical protein